MSIIHRGRAAVSAAVSAVVAVVLSQGFFAPIARAQEEIPALDTLIVTDTRQDSTIERSPSAVTVITGEQLKERQIRQVADALRYVPGLDVLETGAPGQLTSVFTRGLSSEATQVMIDGIPVNQGLAGLFNFADLSTENIERIEVVRGPQSSLYGPRAGGGVVNIITKTGGARAAGSLDLEAGSFGTFREQGSVGGSAGPVDYFAAVNRLDTDNDRPNNQYRSTSGTAKVGYRPFEALRISTLVLYSLADTGNPNTLSNPKPLDNLLTERWLLGPKIEYQALDNWSHTLTVSIDHERQVNDPNEDGFTGPTRALFKRWQVDYQNILDATGWLQLTSGYYYNRTEAEQERPAVSFGDVVLRDKTENHAGFLQVKVLPTRELTLVGSARFDHFSQFGDIGTWRLAANYVSEKTHTILRASAASGFSPATSQDKIFGNNFELDPNDTLGFDLGFEQPFWEKKVRVGANLFYNEASNLVGFDGDFNTFNLGSSHSQGVEAFLTVRPWENTELSLNYTFLDTEKDSSEDIQQPEGARLVRRPRHHFTAAISQRWFGHLRTAAELNLVSGREELSFGAPNFDIEDYVTVRLTADYEITENLHLTARAENLLDEDYAEVFGYPSLGRAFYGGVSLRF